MSTPRGAYGIQEVPSSTPGAITCQDPSCGRSWLEDITPAGRCPWEAHHEPDQDEPDLPDVPEHSEEWIIVWFPSDVEKRERKFSTEEAARSFAEHGVYGGTDGYRVRDWNPLMVHRRTVTTERMIAL